ncbi:hypothetical protein ONZ45_g4670 [Pleurotus djamor]|nr:hypothetical protein ONZ45_g4670 [Pleurotus djamor]
MDAISTIIQQLKSLYKTPPDSLRLPSHPVLDNPWYLVAAVSFNAARQPEAIIDIYQSVLEDLKSNGYYSGDDHAVLVKKLQGALLHASTTSGQARVVTTIMLLNGAVPQSILDRLSTPLPDMNMSMSDLEARGRYIINKTFGQTGGAKLQSIIDSACPSIAMFRMISFGFVHDCSTVLSPLETSYVLLASSIFNDFPREVCWYYLAAMEHGATVDEVKSIRRMALEVASYTKITLREEVPEVVPKESLPVY